MYGDTTMIRRFGRWSPTLAALAAGLLFLCAPQGARATLMLEVTQDTPISGGISDIIFVDNNFGVTPGSTGDPDGDGDVDIIGNDENPATGAIGIGSSVPQQVGAFLVTANVDTSASPTGQLISGATAVLNNSSTTHSQTIKVGDTNYSNPGGTVSTFNAVTSSFSHPVPPGTTPLPPSNSDSIVITNFLDPANKQFGGTPDHPGANTIFGPVTFTPASGHTVFSQDVITGPFNAGSLYSLTELFTVTLAAGDQLTSRSDEIRVTATAVPEPASFALVLSGLPLVGLAAWRRSRRKLS